MDRILAKLVWSASILQLPFYLQGQFYHPTFTIQLLQRARVMKHLKRAATDFGGASVFPSFQLGLLPSSIGGHGIYELQLYWRNCQELGCGMASSLIWRFCLVLSWWKDLGKGTLMERYRNNVVDSLKDPTSGCFKTTDQPPLFSNQNSVISVAFGCKSFWDNPPLILLSWSFLALVGCLFRVLALVVVIWLMMWASVFHFFEVECDGCTVPCHTPGESRKSFNGMFSLRPFVTYYYYNDNNNYYYYYYCCCSYHQYAPNFEKCRRKGTNLTLRCFSLNASHQEIPTNTCTNFC